MKRRIAILFVLTGAAVGGLRLAPPSSPPAEASLICVSYNAATGDIIICSVTPP